MLTKGGGEATEGKRNEKVIPSYCFGTFGKDTDFRRELEVQLEVQLEAKARVPSKLNERKAAQRKRAKKQRSKEATSGQVGAAQTASRSRQQAENAPHFSKQARQEARGRAFFSARSCTLHLSLSLSLSPRSGPPPPPAFQLAPASWSM